MRQLFVLTAAIAGLELSGCAGALLRTVGVDRAAAAKGSAEEDRATTLVADMTRPYGMNFVQVEGISLVTGLAGTGEDPPQTPQRAALLAEMRRREIANPSNVLASPDTALVLVKGLLRPGIQKGDRFDVEVRVPTRSDTKSLRGGWLLPTRLTELAVLDERIHNGRLLGTAEGPLLIDPAADASEAALLTRGRVLGGGIAHKDRALGLVVDEEFRSVATSQRIGALVNRRFHTFDSGSQRGVARPKTDEFIELKVHPRYQDNIARYMKIVRRIAVDETPIEQLDRLQVLEDQLRDPLTASEAALRLEAIGGDTARDTLKRVLDATDIEVRFYAAESLAYLDDSAAAETLAEAARNEPAFRLNAMAALAAMDDPLARQALTSLLGVKSAETQYGAFRALWSMDPHDPLIEGERLGDQFSYHRLPVAGPPMIHATRSFRPELVLFGTDHPLRNPLVVEAGHNILIKGEGDSITVSRFVVDEPTQQRVVPANVDAVVRAIVELGGSYPDVVQALQEANAAGALASRFRVDALPEPGRTYDRADAAHAAVHDPPTLTRRIATPLPNYFRQDPR